MKLNKFNRRTFMQRGAYAGIAAIGVPLLARGGDYFIQFTGANSAERIYSS
jgi:hypothetical protein